jgi:hypothetical protein
MVVERVSTEKASNVVVQTQYRLELLFFFILTPLHGEITLIAKFFD